MIEFLKVASQLIHGEFDRRKDLLSPISVLYTVAPDINTTSDVERKTDMFLTDLVQPFGCKIIISQKNTTQYGSYGRVKRLEHMTTFKIAPVKPQTGKDFNLALENILEKLVDRSFILQSMEQSGLKKDEYEKLLNILKINLSNAIYHRTKK